MLNFSEPNTRLLTLAFCSVDNTRYLLATFTLATSGHEGACTDKETIFWTWPPRGDTYLVNLTSCYVVTPPGSWQATWLGRKTDKRLRWSRVCRTLTLVRLREGFLPGCRHWSMRTTLTMCRPNECQSGAWPQRHSRPVGANPKRRLLAPGNALLTFHLTTSHTHLHIAHCQTLPSHRSFLHRIHFFITCLVIASSLGSTHIGNEGQYIVAIDSTPIWSAGATVCVCSN